SPLCILWKRPRPLLRRTTARKRLYTRTGNTRGKRAFVGQWEAKAMDYFRVRSGQLDVNVWATDAWEAVEKAVRECVPGTVLGIMVSAQGRGQPWYFATEHLRKGSVK